MWSSIWIYLGVKVKSIMIILCNDDTSPRVFVCLPSTQIWKCGRVRHNTEISYTTCKNWGIVSAIVHIKENKFWYNLQITEKSCAAVRQQTEMNGSFIGKITHYFGHVAILNLSEMRYTLLPVLYSKTGQHDAQAKKNVCLPSTQIWKWGLAVGRVFFLPVQTQYWPTVLAMVARKSTRCAVHSDIITQHVRTGA